MLRTLAFGFFFALAAGLAQHAVAQGGPGAMCGGIAGLQCADGLYCQHQPGGCQIADGAGICVERPAICTKIYLPVCGCDQKTYPNACEAAAAGASLSHPGPCLAGGGQGGMCTQEYAPVCGTNGVTYPNMCFAQTAGAPIAHPGACGSPADK